MLARCLTFIALLLLSAAPAAAMPQVWLAPLDNLPHPAPLAQGAGDYEDLFAPGATWPAQLPQVKVFKIYGYFSGSATDAQLRQLFAFLRAHHIKLALEHGVLTASASCGRSEGYNGQFVAPIAERIKRLGGTLDYLAMDEPLYYGNYYSGPGACHDSPEALAANAAQNIAAVRAIMPGIQVGDIEVGNGLLTPPVWAGEIGVWAQAFQAATGHKLAFLHLDVIWSQPWLGNVIANTQAMHARGIPVGVIFNAGDEIKTDPAWAAAVRAHYTALLQAGYVPDEAVFQTWVPQPTRVLPVSDPASLTGLVHGYVSVMKQRQAQ